MRSQIERMLLKKDQINTEHKNIQESIGLRCVKLAETMHAALATRSSTRTGTSLLTRFMRSASQASRTRLSGELIETIIEPLKFDLAQTFNQEQHRQANADLRQLGIVIHIDSEKMLLGLAIGDGEIDEKLLRTLPSRGSGLPRPASSRRDAPAETEDGGPRSRTSAR